MSSAQGCPLQQACASFDGTMVISHFPAMVLYAFLVSVVFGVIAKNTTRERLLYGLKSFALFIGIALLIGWLMYPFPRHG
jgi:hypothetical protein